MRERLPETFDLHRFADQLAGAIGGAWARRPCEVDPEERRCELNRCWWLTIDGPGEAAVSVSTNRHEGAVTVRGEWPRSGGHRAGGQEYPPRGYPTPRYSASVTPTRDLATLARDITRRVLIPYLEALPACLAARAAHQAQRAAMWETADALGDLLGSTRGRPEDRADTNRDRVMLYAHNPLGLDVTVYAGGRVDLKLDGLSRAEAERIIAGRLAWWQAQSKAEDAA